MGLFIYLFFGRKYFGNRICIIHVRRQNASINYDLLFLGAYCFKCEDFCCYFQERKRQKNNNNHRLCKVESGKVKHDVARGNPPMS